MSLHVVVNEDRTKKWVYGWDSPLQTFFLQVHNLELAEDYQIIVWLGTGPRDTMYEVEDLVIAARKQGLRIDYDMRVKLYGEKDGGV